ncbi:hypothetical protein K438DRAFT_1974477 [Mycena galopus ATCC 62051]|nr:hypothetical protein K438DRAFT_1974477 [Mycena galopus ATCC 62051]
MPIVAARPSLLYTLRSASALSLRQTLLPIVSPDLQAHIDVGYARLHCCRVFVRVDAGWSAALAQCARDLPTTTVPPEAISSVLARASPGYEFHAHARLQYRWVLPSSFYLHCS